MVTVDACLITVSASQVFWDDVMVLEEVLVVLVIVVILDVTKALVVPGKPALVKY